MDNSISRPNYTTANTIPHSARRRDTLLKASLAINSTHKRTLAASVAAMVETELDGNCHIADTDSFLESIFPLPRGRVESIFQRFQDNGIYDKESWKDLPTTATLESNFYAPFTNLANEINKACVGIGLQRHVETYWFDRHSTSPQSRDEDAAEIRPDIVSVLGKSEAFKALEKELEERISKIKNSKKKVCVFDAITGTRS
jgi:hypothetical protein